ncbi:MAG: transketolase [Rickettsiales bacterium]|nr:transketolase [Rickettsiales bacterium]
MNNELTTNLSNCIRFLSIDAVQRANSGHPGMPMGIADVATILFSEFLKFNPKDPNWLNRDRFILSAGHGSMLIYSLLYLTGYDDITLDDIKNFRQLGAKCAGHPEFGHIDGIETTTGPLGQGITNAVGMALAEKMLKARIGEDLIDHKIYCIAGDGCLMEGISQEAISIAGNLKLNNLVVLWDDNSISIDGNTNLTTNENMRLRFEACNWNVIEIDGHNFDEIRDALSTAQTSNKPIMIACKTTIGYGSPAKSGTEKCHGSPLGDEEIKVVRKNLNWPHGEFEIPEDLKNKWLEFGQRSLGDYNIWQEKYEKADNKYLDRVLKKEFPTDLKRKIDDFAQEIISKKEKKATRQASGQVLELLCKELDEMVGGSADLTGSVLTKTSDAKAISANDFSGSYIHYGVREHAMGAIMNGLALHSNFIPFAGTFLVFADYMKPAIRLAALMEQQVIYVFTHDSIGLGEDGPTHQPIEHLAMLRGIPNLNVFRPCDMLETLKCYEQALNNKKTPSAIVLTRQGLPHIDRKEDKTEYGAYIISEESNPDTIIYASGSEVEVALQTKEELNKANIKARIISVPSFELFDKQDKSYKEKILGEKNVLKVAIEAGIGQGWHKFLNNVDYLFCGMNSFGASGKAEDLFKHFGINSQDISRKIINYLK